MWEHSCSGSSCGSDEEEGEEEEEAGEEDEEEGEEDEDEGEEDEDEEEEDEGQPDEGRPELCLLIRTAMQLLPPDQIQPPPPLPPASHPQLEASA